MSDLLAQRPSLPDTAWGGRGIVICAGGIRMFANAWVAVRLLRATLRSVLPIEVWHLGPEEMSSGMREMLEHEDVTVVDAHARLSRFPAAISDGRQLKAYALIMSRFREVLLLDADNVPVRDPAFLFDTPDYAETGAVFWPDSSDVAAANPVWAELGLPSRQRASFEGGQMLVDKSRHSRALHALLCINEQPDRFYDMIYLHKDAPLAAWLVTGAAFSLMPHRPFVDRHVVYQRDADGDVLFQHRTNGKWTYAGPQSDSEAFVHGAACEDALSQLRHRWNGRIFEAPRRSREAVAIQREMENRIFTLSRPGFEDRELELLGGCQIGRGRDFDSETWVVTDDDAAPGAFRLEISDRHKIVWSLMRRPDGNWVEAGGAEGAVGLAAKSFATAPPARNVDLVRDLVSTILHDGRWTGEAGYELRVTLAALCRIDRLIADDLEGYIDRNPPSDPDVLEGLLGIARLLRQNVQALPRRRGPPSRPDLLADPDFYVRA